MFNGEESFLFDLTVLLTMAFVFTYPVYRLLHFLLKKNSVRGKSSANLTFACSATVVLAYSLGVHGFSRNGAILFMSQLVALIYWLFLDYRRMTGSSAIIKVLDNKWFRYPFGIVVFAAVLTVSMGLTRFDIYYVTPLVITILYMIFVYRRPSARKNVLLNKKIPSAEANG